MCKLIYSQRKLYRQIKTHEKENMWLLFPYSLFSSERKKKKKKEILSINLVILIEIASQYKLF